MTRILKVKSKKTEPCFQGSALVRISVETDDPYFACALSAAMSASLRKVITPILLSR